MYEKLADGVVENIIIYHNKKIPVTRIAKELGISRSVIYKIIKNHDAKVKSKKDKDDEIVKSVHENVHVLTSIPARAIERDVHESVHENVHENVKEYRIVEEPKFYVTKSSIISAMAEQYMSETELYKIAKKQTIENPLDGIALSSAIQHQRNVQSSLNSLAKWIGLDGESYEDANKVIDVEDVRKMTFAERVALADRLCQSK